jgi:hypothetical protein
MIKLKTSLPTLGALVLAGFAPASATGSDLPEFTLVIEQQRRGQRHVLRRYRFHE